MAIVKFCPPRDAMAAGWWPEAITVMLLSDLTEDRRDALLAAVDAEWADGCVVVFDPAGEGDQPLSGHAQRDMLTRLCWGFRHLDGATNVLVVWLEMPRQPLLALLGWLVGTIDDEGYPAIVWGTAPDCPHRAALVAMLDHLAPGTVVHSSLPAVVEATAVALKEMTRSFAAIAKERDSQSRVDEAGEPEDRHPSTGQGDSAVTPGPDHL